MKRNRILLILLIVLVVVVVVALVKGGGGGEETLEVEKAQKRELVATVSASGKIFPVDELIIIPEIAGEVIELHVEEGDSVKQGDKLAKINPNIYQDAVKRAEAGLLTSRANLGNAKARYEMAKSQFKQAELQYKRQKKLYEDGVISESEMETAQTNYEVAQGEVQAAYESVDAAKYGVQSSQATLQEAKNNLNRTTIYAPMDGIVTSLNVEEGKVVGGISTFSATEMMRVSNLAVMEVRVDVNENDVLNIEIGDTAIIDVEAYDDREFKGVVTQISSSAANTSAQQLTSEQVTNFTVKIRVLPSSYQDLIQPEKGKFPFLPGMSATTDIITERKQDVVSIPIEAVTTRKDIPGDSTRTEEKGGEDFKEVVFTVEDGVAKLQVVKTGIQDEEHIEVISGIAEGDKVAVGPYTTVQQLLRDGDPVEVKEEDKKK